MREPLPMHCQRQPIFIADQMFEHPTQPSSILLEMANVRAIICMKEDDHDTDGEISNDESEDPGESTLSSDIEEDDVDIRQEVLHQHQVRRDKTIWTTRVPLPKKRSHSDTVIACAPLPNLRHPAGAIAPPLLKHKTQSSTYHASLTLYRHSRFPRLVETRMFLNQRLVEITTFLNTKRLLLR